MTLNIEELRAGLAMLQDAARAAFAECADLERAVVMGARKVEELDSYEQRIQKYAAKARHAESELERARQGQSLSYLLGQYLQSQHLTSADEWLKSWDTDGGGRIELSEWRSQLAQLNLFESRPVPPEPKAQLAEITDLFHEIDDDGDGRVTSKEAHKALMKWQLCAEATAFEIRAAESQLQLARDSVERLEAAVRLVLASHNAEEVHKQAVRQQDEVPFEVKVGKLFLGKRAQDVIASWDDNGDGTITMMELRKVLGSIGTEKEIFQFFLDVDADRSGALDIKKTKANKGADLKKLLPKIKKLQAAAEAEVSQLEQLEHVAVQSKESAETTTRLLNEVERQREAAEEEAAQRKRHEEMTKAEMDARRMKESKMTRDPGRQRTNVRARAKGVAA